MSIPISINQLSKLSSYQKDSTEVIDWFQNNGFERIIELSKFLEFPVFKEEGFNKQILRSWMGRKVISELSNIIIIPSDNDGIELFNTIEDLLEKQKEISTLDILKGIPSNEIKLDLDNLIFIISFWKKELEEQQNLVSKLNLFEKTKQKLVFNLKENNNNLKTYQKKFYVSHRNNPLNVEVWRPGRFYPNKDLIIFMPGLGGDIGNFRWIGKELGKRGWPIVFIDHAGSNAETLKAVIKGEEALPGGADNYLYRVKDLNAIIKAHKRGSFGFKKDSYILMGHSLGSLISFLYEGNPPLDGFESRCDKSLVDFALTNLSKLLQCQLSEIPLPEISQSDDLKALIGFNNFGSLIWPGTKNSGIKVPILLIGGTYDLITPLVSEQFKMFLSTESNNLSRFLVIDGASHFSPIRFENKNSNIKTGEDVFKIKETFIGSHPIDFQKIAINVIIQFLNKLEKNNSLDIVRKQNAYDLNFHILGEKEIKEIYSD